MIYPWPALEFEIRAQEVVGGFPPTTSKGEIASFWMQMQLLGDAVAEKSGVFFPGMDWELDEAETCALFSATPFTTDEKLVGRIVAFAEASRRLVVPDDSLDDRTRFRAVLIGLAKKSRHEWLEAVDRARRKRSGLRVVDIAPGWFRIEYPRNVAEIRRALREEGRDLSRSAAKPRVPEWTPEGQERFEAAENFALSIWPWDELGFELQAIDFLTNLTVQTPARTPRASFWALAQVFGPDWGTACRTLIPGIEVKFSDQEVRTVLSVSPVTTDETTIGRIVAFGEAAWRFYAPQPTSPRTAGRSGPS